MRRVLAFTLALLAPSIAAAQTTDDDLARAHFESGSAYYEQGRYDDAAREFLESYRLSPRSVLLVNMARAQERGLHFEEAIATLEQLLRDHPNYPQATTIRDRIQSYERLRDRLADQGGDGDAEPQSSPTPVASASPGPSNASPSGSSGQGGGVSVPGIVVLTSGGALGVVSIITGIVSQTIFDRLETDCDGSVCPADLQGDVDTGESLALTSTILMFPSVIAIGIGVVLLIVDSGGGGDQQAGLRFVPGPGDGGIAVEGSF